MSVAPPGLVGTCARSRGCVLRSAAHLPLATFWPRLRRCIGGASARSLRYLLAAPSALHRRHLRRSIGGAFGARSVALRRAHCDTFWPRLRRCIGRAFSAPSAAPSVRSNSPPSGVRASGVRASGVRASGVRAALITTDAARVLIIVPRLRSASWLRRPPF